MPGPTDPCLRCTLAGLKLVNPVVLASGCAGYIDELGEVLDLSRVGAVVSKSITPQPREGNPTWRIAPSRCGMLNSIGLANVGLDRFIEHLSPRIADAPAPVVVSIAGFCIDDYVRVAAAIDDLECVRAVEVNVSCPNVASGVEIGVSVPALRDLVRAIRPVLSTTAMWIKLSPVALGETGIVDLARCAIDPGAGAPSGGPGSRPGADALTIANTLPAMAIDVRTRRPVLAHGSGGLSGPALHLIAVKLVYDAHRGVARSTETPIIGLGGVSRWRDAAQLILAGASAIGVGTILFADPRAPIRIAAGLARWVRRSGCRSISDLVGAVDAPEPAA